MTVFLPTTLGLVELVFYVVMGTIMLVDLIIIVMIQLGYQVKIGNTQLVGGSGPRRVIVTIFGYEIAVGGRSEAL